MTTTRRLIIIGIVGLAVIGVVLLREAGRTAGMNPPETSVAREPTAPLPRLVDLGSTTCVPCKMMAPILDRLKDEFAESFVVEVIDVRQDREAAQRYGIRVIPTQIFYDASGTERFRHEGFMSRDAILDRWREVGVNLGAIDPQPTSE